MNNRELNEQTLELLRQKLEKEGDTTLVIAIMINPKTEKFSQLVGYGITMPMITLAFMEAHKNLLFELFQKVMIIKPTSPHNEQDPIEPGTVRPGEELP